jgi:hypothetical protein
VIAGFFILELLNQEIEMYLLFVTFSLLALVTLLSTSFLEEEKAVKVVSVSIASAIAAMVVIVITAIIDC